MKPQLFINGAEMNGVESVEFDPMIEVQCHQSRTKSFEAVIPQIPKINFQFSKSELRKFGRKTLLRRARKVLIASGFGSIRTASINAPIA